MRSSPLALAACALLLAACSSLPLAPVDPAARQTMLRYDANKDGIVTRAELEAGLAAEFAAADTNHDGKLDPAEITAVNNARWQADASRTTPIQDWNQDGFVDAREFGTEVRNLYDQLDQNHDGVLSKEELSPSAQPRPNSPAGGRGGEGGGRGGGGEGRGGRGQ